MTKTSTFSTPQEDFWANEFGDAYRDRNQGEHLVTVNMALFTKILGRAGGIDSILELGCNIGLNLDALRLIRPSFQLSGVEINLESASEARVKGHTVYDGTILEPLENLGQFDLSFTKGVLIHIHPDHLHSVYDNLVARSKRFVMVCEYYNPKPVTLPYRGDMVRLFKRDFAGEIMDRHGLRLVDYGFSYHRDPYFPIDDVNWFLMEKT